MEDLNGKIDGVAPPDGNLPAIEWNQIPSELQNIITKLGISLLDTDVTQVMSAIAMMVGAADYFTGSFGADENAQVLTVVGTLEPVRSYREGMRVRWLPSVANTGPFTIVVDGMAAKSVFLEDGTTATASGHLATSRYAEAVYDGTNFRLLSRSMDSITTSPMPLAYAMTPHIVCDAGEQDISFVSDGAARSADNSINGAFTGSTIVKDFSAAFSLGTLGGMYPSGALPRSVIPTGYYIFMIMKNDGSIDYGCDDNSSATNLLADAVSLGGAGWTGYRRIGTVWSQSTGDLGNTYYYGFTHTPGSNYFRWWEPETQIVSSWTTAAASYSVRAPNDSVAEVRFSTYVNYGTQQLMHVLAFDASVPVGMQGVPGASNHTFRLYRESTSTVQNHRETTSLIGVTSQFAPSIQLEADVASATIGGNPTITISVLGYFFNPNGRF